MHILDDEFNRAVFATFVTVSIGIFCGGLFGLIIGVLNSFPPFSYFNFEIDPIRSACFFAVIGLILAVVAVIDVFISEYKSKQKNSTQK
ncbi:MULTISPECIES: hypothetical protein [Acinetobacter calcoaceticus/baumannii complex]|uniref:hypothetical protein n=1 Tax=Acinetobacter calcoaceticus/baumannii complex TaxID=909768 RepID=UPI000C22C172|nr:MULTISPECIES: hypothetical protein [Acinetobacter calcoaceticus/baumannii complex]PJG65538.1 hypothetical protein CVD09_15815 [Acinetobacter seifertii]RIX34708.1 hypothetical protein D3X57_19880 [Acinetobacter baumannii]RIX39222.1 hypothetical protein D3X54_17565 [Acinetobacter baumannii]RJO32791.1 hypothetical protein D3X44_16215 [Acinetobacter baumannii]